MSRNRLCESRACRCECTRADVHIYACHTGHTCVFVAGTHESEFMYIHLCTCTCAHVYGDGVRARVYLFVHMYLHVCAGA